MAQVPSYVPTNGLVGWWPFNGNADDESGNGNNGTVIGATLTADRFGNANRAYSFDGFDDFIQLNSIGIIGDQNRSFSFHSKLNTVNLSSDLSAIAYGGNSSSCSQAGNDNEYGFMNINNNASARIDGTCTAIWSTNTIQDTQWHHVVFTFDNNQGNQFNYFKIYIDGFVVSLGTYNGSTTLNTISLADLVFGKSNKLSRFFDGLLDDIGIWNRALTEQEIANLYNGCSNTSITSQPANTIANPTTAAQFSIAASNVTSYQWQTDLGVGFQNVSNAGQFSGATNDTLTVSNVSTTNNNQQFRCIINSNGCVDTSTVAVLSVSTNGVNELVSEKNFAIFPNPAKSNFEIKTDLSYDKIEILDIQGRLVQIEPKNKVISISSLQKGTYIIRLLDEKSNVIGIQQLVKE
jgi:hypothetical protein